MAVQVLRTIYINSDVIIDPESANVGANNLGHPGSQAVQLTQNANFTLNIPRADVNAFGYDGVLDRPQLEAETATLEFSFIAQQAGSGLVNNDLTGPMLNDLVLEAKAQIPDYVGVSAEGVGAVKTALMNSLTGEVSVGALATLTAGFTGANNDPDNPQSVTGFNDPAKEAGGDPADAIAAQAAQEPGSGAGNIGMPGAGSAFRAAGGLVLTPADIGLIANPNSPVSGAATVQLVDEGLEPDPQDADDIQESCAQSASFSWDMPVEIILCLGSDPAVDGLALGNPPGSSSITVEALTAQLSHFRLSQNYTLMFGAYHIGLMAANVDSRTHNLAVGDLYGTYNYVLGSTGDSFEIG